jgi:hypothetical protein
MRARAPFYRFHQEELSMRTSIIRLLALLLSASSAFICATAFAQQRVGGAITNKTTGAPVSGATINLESDLLSTALTTTSDAEGRFSFANLSPGRYDLSVSADTFHRRQLTFTLGPRATRQFDFELSPIATIKEQVTVKPQEKLLDETETATATALTRQQIETLPLARRAQLTEIITPFVSGAVAGHDNLVHLRGNELSLNTFVNGVSFFDNPHQLFTAGLAPDVIQSVNVVTGGFPAEFGNRFGGILDVVTRNGFDAKNRGGLTVGAGNYLRDNVAFDYGGHTEKFGYFFYGQGFQSLRYLNTPEPVRRHDFGKGSHGFAQFDYRPNDRDSFRLLLSGDGANFQLPNTAHDEEHGRDFFQRNREQTAVLSWTRAFSGAAILSTSLYERYVKSRLLPTSDSESIQASGARHNATFGVKSDYSLFIGSRHAVKAGIDLMRLRLREDFSFDPRDNEIEIEAFDFRGRQSGGQASLYLQDKIQVTRRFTANLGLRYDNYSLVASGQALSPRVNLAYSLQGGRTVLSFAYNRFFAPPPIENLLLSAHLGPDGSPPQISRSNFFETGVNRALGDRLVVRASGFWRSDKHSFETAELANVRVFAPTTLARGKAYGIETSLQLTEIGRLGLSGYLSYTAQRAFHTGPLSGGFTGGHDEHDEHDRDEHDDHDEQSEPGERFAAAFDQIHTVVAGLNYRERRSGFFAAAQFEYGSGTPAALPNDDHNDDHDGDHEDDHGSLVRLPGHFVANFYFGIDLLRRERRGVTLQFNIENATNSVFRIAKESEFTPVQYSPPRFVSASLTYRF